MKEVAGDYWVLEEFEGRGEEEEDEEGAQVSSYEGGLA